MRLIPLLVPCRLATLLCCLAQTTTGRAAEQLVLRFVEQPQTNQHVVRAGDLLEVLSGKSASTELLLATPLGPAPREGEWQMWHSQDVLQHLELRGYHAESMRWTGATEARLQRVADLPPALAADMQPAFVGNRTMELAEQYVAQAIREYLHVKTGERVDWVITVNIPPALADSVRTRRNIVGIGGGRQPWIGDQQFTLQIKQRDQLSHAHITAKVELPPMVVVAKRPLRRDEVLTAEALDFASLPPQVNDLQSKFFADPQELIGQQLRRSVSTGMPISSDFVGAPIVIGRNELIEIESVSGPVVVRTSARSLGSGAVGDLIEVEIIPTKQRMLATVVEPMKVRVVAVTTRIASESR